MRWGAGRVTAAAQARFIEGVAYCDRFFMGQAEAQKALFKLTSILESEGIPYAVIGALALNEYGHRRAETGKSRIARQPTHLR
jgi:hypothetical protein